MKGFIISHCLMSHSVSLSCISTFIKHFSMSEKGGQTYYAVDFVKLLLLTED